jgi:hypothetical protein
MIEETKFKSVEFNQALLELEDAYINELEDMLISKLMEQKTIQLQGNYDEVIEFAGKTNYKIRLRIPNKNVWSIPFREFRESIRKVLRIGTSGLMDNSNQSALLKKVRIDFPTALLLNVLPEKEYKNRSFVGNPVVHPTYGDGCVIRISDSGNVEVQFKDRMVRLKPNFIKLKTN